MSSQNFKTLEHFELLNFGQFEIRNSITTNSSNHSSLNNKHFQNVWVYQIEIVFFLSCVDAVHLYTFQYHFLLITESD